MIKNSSLRRRILARIGARIGVGIAATAVAMLALPGAAQAHVTVQPRTAEGGGFSVVAFRVPNERDDARTTEVRVTLPSDQPIGSVQTTPVPGWKITTATRQLDKPIEMFGEQLNTVVSEVIWTATAGGIRPGQFQDFELSLGQLPQSGQMVFNALQAYSSGEKVNWNQISADPAVEPEHPAPILRITPAAAEHGAPASESGVPAGQADTSTAQPESGAAWTLSVVLSAAAFVLSVATAVLVWHRTRRPSPVVESPSEPSREDVKV
jgi:uncharacterized protein YcnI